MQGARERARGVCAGKWGVRCGARAGRGRRTFTRGRHVERGASRRREPSERWSRRRPATGNRTPTPDDHLAARGAQPAGARHGTGRHKHQSKQRRHAGLSRSMPPSRVVERVETCSGSDMSHPCTTRRWCRKCRCRTHAQSSPARNSSFLSSSAILQMYFSESVSGGS